MIFYLDENLPFKIARGLNELLNGYDPTISVKHITDDFAKGTSDENWITELSKVKALIFTKDQRIFSEKSSRAVLAQSSVGIIFYVLPKKKGASYWEIVEFIIENIIEIIDFSRNNITPYALKIEMKRKLIVLQLQ